MNVLVVLLWIWLFVSLGIYAYRVARRFGRRDPDQSRSDEDTSPRSGPPLIVDGQRVEPGVATALTDPSARIRRDADPVASTPASSVPSAPRRPVAEAVRGIQMPCDLAPLLGAGESADPYRVLFTTRGVSPVVVAGGLGAELERLGYAMTQTGLETYDAVREGSVVQVVIHPESTDFRTAPAGSVVVELST